MNIVKCKIIYHSILGKITTLLKCVYIVAQFFDDDWLVAMIIQNILILWVK
jgi:hypothetical protein